MDILSVVDPLLLEVNYFHLEAQPKSINIQIAFQKTSTTQKKHLRVNDHLEFHAFNCFTPKIKHLTM